SANSRGCGMATQHAAAADGSVVTQMDFCPPGEKVIFYPSDREKSQWPYRPHEVRIADMRPIAHELSFDRNGFVLLERPSAVRDFYDAGEVERVYLPEVVEMITALTGADKVITFGTMLRTDRKDARQGNLPAFG